MPTLATPVPTTDHNYGVDYPVRVEAPMPRDLFDRLTDHDHAPICRYEEASGLAEFVAMPGVSHEGRAGLIARLFAHIEFTMLDAGLSPAFFHGLATRLLSDDGAFEPDASLFVNPSHAIVAGELGRLSRHPRRSPGSGPRRGSGSVGPVQPQAAAVFPHGRAGGMDLEQDRRDVHLGSGCDFERRDPAGGCQRRAAGRRTARSRWVACRWVWQGTSRVVSTDRPTGGRTLGSISSSAR